MNSDRIETMDARTDVEGRIHQINRPYKIGKNILPFKYEWAQELTIGKDGVNQQTNGHASEQKGA